MADLFPDAVRDERVSVTSAAAPLAERLRPRALDEVVGTEYVRAHNQGGQDSPFRTTRGDE